MNQLLSSILGGPLNSYGALSDQRQWRAEDEEKEKKA